MRSNKMRFSRILPAMLLGGVFVLSGCDNSKDIYNPDRIQEEAKEAFPVKNIDPNQTWETSTVCNASVSVNEKSGEVFTIKLYSGNPYNTNGDARLLAKATVTDGQTVNFKFDAPTALEFVYVMKVNSKGYSSAIPVAVENGAVKVMFGGEGADTRAVAATRAGGNQFFTPEVPKEEVFPAKAPDNCGDISKYGEQTNKIPYLLKDNTYSKINPWSGGDIYIQGNVTLKSWSEPSGITNFYLLPNATLTLEMKQFNHRHNSIFSIGSGAKLIANNTTLVGEEGSKYFNKGTIKAEMIKPINSYVYNANTIETKKVLLTNANSKFCNATDGKLVISELEIQGNGHFLNETDGVVEVNGLTTLNCTGGSWENAGHYTTTNMHMSAWNRNIKNACWLTVTEELKLTDAGVYNENYIECKNLYMNNATVNMAQKSFFVVKEEAKFGYNKEQGFIASTSGEKAVLKMKRAIRTSGNDNMVYSGKLVVACNDHFDKQKDQWNSYYELKNGAELSGADNANIVIPSSECNPGYNSTPDGGGDNDTPQAYAYAFEDMMQEVGDYDFNDVVLYVSTPIDGKITVSLQAAGATKKLSVGFNNNGNIQNVFADVHEALKVPAGTITNTGMASGTVATAEITVGKDFSLTNNGDFYISDGKREIHIPNFTIDFKPGNVPYALRVASATWKWAKERIQITEAYPDFAGWAQNATAEPTWYNNPVSDKVMD